ncbi:gluconokinase [Roseomonas sp. OT10]|uniref:gluconokinase n=1 Tax=Roseomonas cutis TaxID=2897332 RepID=UPI001E319644|nr:gluconokinase [Roseomonas sp. OT10]UFN49505.1 gluconokinase [Roseomonas sp. OT10]
MPPRLRVVVMGVSGAGKSTVGKGLADRLGLPFGDADDFHPPANIAKQAAGQPLNDDDRAPWLAAIGAWLASESGGVATCSALKRAYRDRLRAACPGVAFLHLTGPQALIAARQAARKGHFMPASLIASQFATLEIPDPEEGVIPLDVSLAPEALVEIAVAELSRRSAGT